MTERMIESNAMPADSEAEEQANASVRGRPFVKDQSGMRRKGNEGRLPRLAIFCHHFGSSARYMRPQRRAGTISPEG